MPRNRARVSSSLIVMALMMMFAAQGSTYAKVKVKKVSADAGYTPSRPAASGSPNQDEDKYPKPDFSAMEKWYEIVKWEYSIFDQRINLVIKPKVESRPWLFEMRFEDADGVLVSESSACSYYLQGSPAGEPIKCGIMTPTEKQMEKVKKVYVIRKKEGS